MYSDKELVKVLRKNLDSELDVVKFYIDNLKNLNHVVNAKKIDKLLFESYKHAMMLSKRLIALETPGPLKKKVVDEALLEEQGFREIYYYELNKICDAKTAKAVRKIAIDEERHELLVKNLR